MVAVEKPLFAAMSLMEVSFLGFKIGVLLSKGGDLFYFYICHVVKIYYIKY